jgi:hypothetical protein
MPTPRLPPAALLLLPGLLACAPDGPKGEPAGEGDACADAGTTALSACVEGAVAAHAACLAASDALCAPDDPALTAAFAAIQAEAEGACAGDPLAEGGAEATEGLAATCALQVESLVGRVAGGPQAAVWAAADPARRACIEAAVGATAGLVTAGLDGVTDCLSAGDCGGWSAGRADAEAEALAAVEAACPDLAAAIAIDPALLVQKAAAQVDCLVAAAHPDRGDLSLECGPAAAAFEAPRGAWTQVLVDGATWGTKCADGGPYAFWIRPAPEGAPLDRLMIGLEGGGVCVFEEDCAGRAERAPELFSALDNEAPVAPGIGSQDPAESPFADWTHVYLPYCTQDVFAGGGVDEDLGSIVVPRYGAVNARASVTMIRDWLWRELEADPARPEGYRQDRVQALFGGWSAGSYGTLYNYAWVLDELGWPRTTAFPDAGLALDNGEALGVAALGVVKIPAWGTLPFLPPYCFHSDCALGSEIAAALAPRLLRVPEQQLLMLSNQVDDIQAGDAYFSTREGFVNALRQTFCDTRDLNGVSWYLTGVSSESVHVITPREELWSAPVAGVTLRDWMAAAAAGERAPSLAEEADLVTAVPGAEPFPCALD